LAEITGMAIGIDNPDASRQPRAMRRFHGDVVQLRRRKGRGGRHDRHENQKQTQPHPDRAAPMPTIYSSAVHSLSLYPSGD
jgi:hypothetical protein